MIGSPTLVSNPTNYSRNVKSSILVLSVESGSPAESAGLTEGDEILKVNGQEFTSLEQFQAYTRQNRGKQVSITYLAQGQEKTQDVTLQDKEQGALGVAVAENSEIKLSFFKAIYAGFVETGKTIGLVVVAFGRLIKDLITTAKVSEGVAGPVGIYTLTGEAVKLGFVFLLQFIALLTINLGIINILPFPALDGGRLIFIILEKIRGKKVAYQVENTIHLAGFALLIILIVLITYRDIANIIMK
jgi:regulator of sigma E protease